MPNFSGGEPLWKDNVKKNPNFAVLKASDDYSNSQCWKCEVIKG